MGTAGVKASRYGRPLGVVVILGITQVALFLLFHWVTDRRRAVEASFPVECLSASQPWDFAMTRRDGSSMKLSSTRGKPVLVHFWATWCPPCRDELPQVVELSKTLNVVAVSLDSADGVLSHYFGDVVPQPVVRAEEGTARALGVSMLPDTYLLNSDGVPYARFFGAREWQGRDPLIVAVQCEL